MTGNLKSILAMAAELDEWEDWSNRLAEKMPPEYDGDEAQEFFIEQWIDDLVKEVTELKATVNRVRQLHTRVKIQGWPDCCDEDEFNWPCRTILALDNVPTRPLVRDV